LTVKEAAAMDDVCWVEGQTWVSSASNMVGGSSVHFYGVRGSTPCDNPGIARYGGNTSCVVLDVAGHAPIVFDLGTGLRAYGHQLATAGLEAGFRGTVLLTHLHWDHIQGLPFFHPLAHPDSALDVHGPLQAEGPLGDVFEGVMRPPYFPIRSRDLPADIRFHGVGDDQFCIGDAKVRSCWVRHTDPALGFRVDVAGTSVAYISDHGQGCGDDDPLDHIPAKVLELCDGVDLLIHDAQHTADEFATKAHYGHCTVGYAVHVAREAGARQIALFHHDPAHDDDEVDRILLSARDASARTGGPEVVAAREGMDLVLRKRVPAARRAS
jgi:phosphoribosyl 1,2-cyclic phosphodiesterase